MSKLVEFVNEKNTVKNTYTFVMLLEAYMCNPNGDPDMGNLPRQDSETEKGIITDVAIKRRIRDYIKAAYFKESGMDILMQSGTSINRKIAEVVAEANELTEFPEKFKNTKVDDSADIFAKRYWDVRTFGGVLSTGRNAGQITGPVQFGMAESVDPINIEDMTITRMCYTDGKDYKTLAEYEQEEKNRAEDKKRTMGEKKIIPYGLYVVQGTCSPNLAARTGFTEEDLNRLFEALLQSYEFSNTASKHGMRVASPLIIFKHIGTHPENPEMNAKEALLGCMPAHKLFKLFKAEKKEAVVYPRNLEDYEISLTIPEDLRGIDIGLKEYPFDPVVWRNESADSFEKVLDRANIKVK